MSTLALVIIVWVAASTLGACVMGFVAGGTR